MKKPSIDATIRGSRVGAIRLSGPFVLQTDDTPTWQTSPFKAQDIFVDARIRSRAAHSQLNPTTFIEECSHPETALQRFAFKRQNQATESSTDTHATVIGSQA